MARFKLLCRHVEWDCEAAFFYDNETSGLTREDGTPFPVEAYKTDAKSAVSAFAVSRETPGLKGLPKTLKISLGLSCNFSCSYCVQRFVPGAIKASESDVEAFMAMLPADASPDRIEFWGGEPFVYWKTMRPLGDRLRERFPNAVFSVITNGSMLDAEKNEWLDRMGFLVAVSHDGPGQHVRGPDPLDDPTQRAGIVDLFNRLHPKNRFSFNCMVNRENSDRAAINKFFVDLTGNNEVVIGEGAFVDAYDAGGKASSLRTPAEHMAFRRKSIDCLLDGSAPNMSVNWQRINDIVRSIANGRPAATLGQKCGMDRPGQLAVDMKGNVLTCQNVTVAAKAGNGESHKIGHITRLDEVRLKTSTHWSKRAECSSCPVLQSCKGSCMFLQGDLWETSCENSFSDHVPYLCKAVEVITGFVPYYIEGPQRADRQDIFGMVAEEAMAS